jgi:hypothetical protein
MVYVVTHMFPARSSVCSRVHVGYGTAWVVFNGKGVWADDFDPSFSRMLLRS